MMGWEIQNDGKFYIIEWTFGKLLCTMSNIELKSGIENLLGFHAVSSHPYTTRKKIVNFNKNILQFNILVG
jgi:hypothetical protein